MGSRKSSIRRLMSWAVVASMLVQMFAGVVPVLASPPTPDFQTLTSPANMTYVNYNDLVFNWDVATDAHVPVTYKFEISNSSAVNPAPASQFTGGVVFEKDWPAKYAATSLNAQTESVPLSENVVYYWHVRAQDAVGGSANRNAWSEVRSFVIDNSLPTVSITSPSDGALVNGTQSIIANASDIISGISKVEFYNGVTLLYTDSDSSDGFSANFDTNMVSDGDYAFYAKAYDLAGNYKYSEEPISLTVDNTAPATPIITAPAEGVVINPSTTGAAISWSVVSDTHGPVIYTLERYNGVNWTVVYQGDDPYYSLIGENDGDYQWRVKACDVVSPNPNCSALSAIRSTTIDSTAPVGLGKPVAKRQINSLILGLKTSFENIYWEWSEPDSSVAGLNLYKWSLYRDGVSVDSGVTLLNRIDRKLDTEGVYVLRVVAIDLADNETEYAESNPLEYDNTAPSKPSLISPGDGYITNIPKPELKWSASPELDLSGYEFEICRSDPSLSMGICLDRERLTKLTTNYRTLINPLQDGTYWWRVRSIDDVTNKSAWSDAFELTIDTVEPVIDLKGDTTVELTYGQVYKEPGYTASDKYLDKVEVTGDDNLVNVGKYTIAYTAKDKAGNETTIHRYVIIKPATLKVIADDKTRVYGETDPDFSYEVLGLQYNETEDDAFSEKPVCGVDTETINAGPYIVECKGGVLNSVPQFEARLVNTEESEPVSNYVIKYVSGTLVVEKAKLTITAKKQSKFAGEVDPALTYDLTSGSLLFSDTLTGGLSRVSGEDPGFYAITQGSLTAGDNYEIAFVTDELEIKPAPVLVTQGDDTDISSTDTKKDEDVKGKTDKKADVSFWDAKTFGVSNWLWLLLFGALGGWGWWFIAGRQRRDDDEE